MSQRYPRPRHQDPGAAAGARPRHLPVGPAGCGARRCASPRQGDRRLTSEHWRRSRRSGLLGGWLAAHLALDSVERRLVLVDTLEAAVLADVADQCRAPSCSGSSSATLQDSPDGPGDAQDDEPANHGLDPVPTRSARPHRPRSPRRGLGCGRVPVLAREPGEGFVDRLGRGMGVVLGLDRSRSDAHRPPRSGARRIRRPVLHRGSPDRNVG